MMACIFSHLLHAGRLDWPDKNGFPFDATVRMRNSAAIISAIVDPEKKKQTRKASIQIISFLNFIQI